MTNPAPAGRATILALLLGLLLLPNAGCHRGGATSHARSNDWVTLFDGHSTAAWRGYKQEDFPKDSWVIDEDALRTNPAHPLDLITREQFESFELELEWKVARESNSGIFYHVSEEFPETYWTGPEMQVVDD